MSVRSSNRSTPSSASEGAKILAFAPTSPLRAATDSNRLSGWGRRIPGGITWAICSLYVCGCAQPQRDFYQAPPPQPARWVVVTTERQDFDSQIVTALSREGYGFRPLDSVTGFLHGEVRREDAPVGQIIAVEYEPESPSRLAIEVRMGQLGDPQMEQRLAQAVADQLAGPSEGDPQPAPPTLRWSGANVSGRWVDLEAAVAVAPKSTRDVALAVVNVDRWRYATIFEIRSLSAAEGRLIVIGDRQSTSGPRAAYVRFGLFGDPVEEKAFLNRLRANLAELGREQRLPGAR